VRGVTECRTTGEEIQLANLCRCRDFFARVFLLSARDEQSGRRECSYCRLFSFLRHARSVRKWTRLASLRSRGICTCKQRATFPDGGAMKSSHYPGTSFPSGSRLLVVIERLIFFFFFFFLKSVSSSTTARARNLQVSNGPGVLDQPLLRERSHYRGKSRDLAQAR